MKFALIKGRYSLDKNSFPKVVVDAKKDVRPRTSQGKCFTLRDFSLKQKGVWGRERLI